MDSLSDLLEQQAVNRSRLIEEPQFAHSNLEVRLRCIMAKSHDSVQRTVADGIERLFVLYVVVASDTSSEE